MSIFLINPPYSRLQAGVPMPYVTRVKQNLTRTQRCTLPMENLGLMYIASYASQCQISVHVIDAVLEEHAGPEQTLSSLKHLVERYGPPTLIGLTTTVAFEGLVGLLSLCKSTWPSAVTCLGGPFAALNYDRVLRTWPFDCVCVGDGEVVFAELARAVLDGQAWADIPGLATRNTQGDVTVASSLQTDINLLPRPSRRQLRRVLDDGFSAGISTQRGCPYRCTYCVTGTMSSGLGRDGVRVRSIEAVVDEIVFLHRDFQIPFVTIVDDLFVSKSPMSQARAEEFARLMVKLNLPVKFMCDVRVDSISKGLFQLLYRAGLRRVFVGVETGSEDQLRFYKKHHSRSRAATAEQLALLEAIGIEVIAGTIVWHPTVTPSEIRATVALLDSLSYRIASRLRSRLCLYPGTPIIESYPAGTVDGVWPLRQWHFVDPRAQSAFDVVLPVAEDPGATYERAREVLLAALYSWEGSSSPSS